MSSTPSRAYEWYLKCQNAVKGIVGFFTLVTAYHGFHKCEEIHPSLLKWTGVIGGSVLTGAAITLGYQRFMMAKACPLDHVCGICLGKLSRVAGIVDQTVGGESNEVTGFLNEKCGQNLSASTD